MRRLPWATVLMVLAACEGTEVSRPSSGVSAPPSFLISDGNHAGGNPDFFFLPPMVPDPSGSPNWTAGAFDGTLAPSVEVCALSGSVEGDISIGSACGATTTFTFGTGTSNVRVSLTDQLYIVNWKVPTSSVTFFRIKVKVGSTLLGFADVETGATQGSLKNVTTGEFVPLKDGTTLAIKFRIEKCNGTTPCAEGIINLQDGGTITLNGNGVFIPPQGGDNQLETIKVTTCPNLDIDLPLFGSCIRVTADPALPPAGLAVAATVFICDVTGSIPAGMTEDQENRISLHRKDAGDVHALPHAPACGAPLVSTEGSFKGLLRELARGRWRAAGGELASMLAPAPLQARRIDQGGGGRTSEFSDFQFALPTWLRIASGDGQFGAPGGTLAANPTVEARDLGGDPVAGAKVHFVPADGGSVGAAVVTTGATGLAATSWTLGAGGGPQSLKAQGRGLAGPDFNGPRCELVDPFQVIQTGDDHPEEFGLGDCEGGDLSDAILLLTGSVTFNANPAAALPINYGSSGWEYLIDGSPAANWFSAAGPSFPNVGSAPFGSPDVVECSLNLAGVSTSWPSSESTNLRVRKFFTLAAAGTVTIGVAIDNDLQVFLDGVDISASNQLAQAPVGGLLVHDGCPEQDSFTFTTSLSAGTHLLAIRGFDRGTSSYLDVRVTAAP